MEHRLDNDIKDKRKRVKKRARGGAVPLIVVHVCDAYMHDCMCLMMFVFFAYIHTG